MIMVRSVVMLTNGYVNMLLFREAVADPENVKTWAEREAIEAKVNVGNLLQMHMMINYDNRSIT